MKLISTILFSIVTTGALAATVNCKPNSNSMFYSVKFETTMQKKVINVTSSTGGYGSLDLTECKVSRDKKVTTCSRSYFRNEDGKKVSHTARIHVGNPLRTSYVERDLVIPGQANVRSEILNFCEVL
jgi:hypothetical protein